LKPKIYIDSCAFIDMAKVHAKMLTGLSKNEETDRQSNVWFCQKLIEAANDGKIELYTSAITVAECTGVGEGQPSPNDEVQRFYTELLTSGRPINLIQPTQTIINEARDLKWKRQINAAGMDAIHIASAIRLGCCEFLTSDVRLAKRGIIIPKLKIIQARETGELPSEYTQSTLAGISVAASKPKRKRAIQIE
jgi:predicted nucleic acid-binding protein